MNVDFYVCPYPQSQQAQFICELIEHYFKQGSKLLVYHDDAEYLKQLDEQLWTFRDTSFVPHAMHGAASKDTTIPIVLSSTCNAADIASAMMLLNLAATIPATHQQFVNIIETVPFEKELRSTSRQHYKYYQECNYKLNMHQTISA